MHGNTSERRALWAVLSRWFPRPPSFYVQEAAPRRAVLSLEPAQFAIGPDLLAMAPTPKKDSCTRHHQGHRCRGLAVGKNRQPHVPKGSNPEVPCGALWCLPLWLPRMGLSWRWGVGGQCLAQCPAKTQTQWCRSQAPLKDKVTLNTVSFSLPVTGPLCRASLEVWGKGGGQRASCPKAVGLTPLWLTPTERSQKSGKVSHTWIRQGQDPQIGSRGGGSRPFQIRCKGSNRHTHTYAHTARTHTPSTVPSKATSCKESTTKP